jgi:excisionase family DNA binding protein
MHSLVKPTEAAAELRVTVNTVYNWIREGRIPSVRLGGLWRIRRADLNALTAGELTPVPVPVPAMTAVNPSPAIDGHTPGNLSPGVAPAPPLVKQGPHPNDGWITEQRR